jgi:hypothetical protein
MTTSARRLRVGAPASSLVVLLYLAAVVVDAARRSHAGMQLVQTSVWNQEQIWLAVFGVLPVCLLGVVALILNIMWLQVAPTRVQSVLGAVGIVVAAIALLWTIPHAGVAVLGVHP